MYEQFSSVVLQLSQMICEAHVDLSITSLIINGLDITHKAEDRTARSLRSNIQGFIPGVNH